MELVYPQKKTIQQILDYTSSCSFTGQVQEHSLLIKGDNLYVLQKLRENFTNKIDLIYIDPPFSTNNTFTIGDQRVSTISMSFEDEIAYVDNLKGFEYLEFIRERLVLARELLSEEGSIYLHIDYKIGHYIKIIMDEIFGIENFKNDISRIKCNPKNFNRRAYGNIKDLVLFYTKTKNAIWNDPIIPYNDDDIKKLYKKKDKNGRLYTTIPLHAPGETQNGVTSGLFRGSKPPKGRHWRSDPIELEELDVQGLIDWSANGNPRKIIYADEKEGKKMQDIWDFKDYQYPCYPTEKNYDLIKMIISASSKENSIVMDFFIGSGTTLVAAQDLNRKWIGIDQSEQAIKATKSRLFKFSEVVFSDFEYSYLEVDDIIHKVLLSHA